MEKKIKKAVPIPNIPKARSMLTAADKSGLRNLPKVGGQLLDADSQGDEHHIQYTLSQSY